MRSRAHHTALFGDSKHFKDSAAFFRQGGQRDWPNILTPEQISEVTQRLERMVGGEAAVWALHGDDYEAASPLPKLDV